MGIIKRYQLLSIFFVMLLFSFQICAESDKVISKMRAGFMGVKDKILLPSMNEKGMNAALVAFWLMPSPLTEQEQQMLGQWAIECQSNKLDFYPVISFWGNGEKTWMQLTDKYYLENKEYPNTPCPFSEDNYNCLIHDRMLEVARLSKDYPIAGVILDIEMYGADIIAYNNPCFCRQCQDRFRKQFPNASIMDNAKYRELAAKGLIEKIEKTRIAVRNISKSFRIGVTKLDQSNIFSDSLARGFAVPEMPVMIFSEKTYSQGYSNYIPDTIKRFSQAKIPVQFMAGIWQDRFDPNNLAEQYYYCAKACDGYWIYTMQTLNPEWKESIAYSREDYWQAIEKANTELCKLAKNPKYVSPLRLRKARMLLDPVQWASIKVPTLAQVRPEAPIETNARPLYFHSLNKLVFNAKKGQLISFRVKFTKRPDTKVEYAEVALLTNTGKLLAKDKADAANDAVVESVAPLTGTYCIVLNPERNLLSVTGFSHPYSFDAAKWPQSHLIRPDTPLYLWAKPGQKQAKVRFLVDGVGESITVMVKTLQDQLIAQQDILGKQTLTFPLSPNQAGQILVMTIAPRPKSYYEDVIVTLESGLGSYISPFKAGLLIHDADN